MRQWLACQRVTDEIEEEKKKSTQRTVRESDYCLHIFFFFGHFQCARAFFFYFRFVKIWWMSEGNLFRIKDPTAISQIISSAFASISTIRR